MDYYSNYIKNYMSLIKNSLKTEEQKALEFFGFIRGGELTQEGLIEFLFFLYEKNEDLRKEFNKTVVELYKKRKYND